MTKKIVAGARFWPNVPSESISFTQFGPGLCQGYPCISDRARSPPADQIPKSASSAPGIILIGISLRNSCSIRLLDNDYVRQTNIGLDLLGSVMRVQIDPLLSRVDCARPGSHSATSISAESVHLRVRVFWARYLTEPSIRDTASKTCFVDWIASLAPCLRILRTKHVLFRSCQLLSFVVIELSIDMIKAQLCGRTSIV